MCTVSFLQNQHIGHKSACNWRDGYKHFITNIIWSFTRDKEGTRSCTLVATRFSCQVQTTRQRADEFSVRSSILFSARTSRKRKGFYNFQLTAQNTRHLSLSNVQKQQRRKWCFKLPLFYLPPSIPYFHFLWSMTGTWAVVSARAWTGSAFLLDNGASHNFHKFWSVFADRVQKTIKCPGRLDVWRLWAVSCRHQKSILRSIYKTSW